MGTALIDQKIDLPLPLWSANCNLTHPKTVLKIHQDNISAGADYITANTFRTTPRAYQKTGLSKTESIDKAKNSLVSAVQLAKEAALNHVEVIGSIAPLEDCYSPELFPGKKTAIQEFSQITEWMINENVDVLLFETMNNITEIEAAMIAVQNVKCPVWVSLFLQDEYHLGSGESLKSCIGLLQNYRVDCLLLNCNSLEITLKAMNTLINTWKRNWGIYPNLGVGKPAVDGCIEQFSSDEEFLNTIRSAVDLGATVIGGCCGTTSEQIKLLTNIFNP